MKKRVLILLINILFLISITSVFALDLSDYPAPFVVAHFYDSTIDYVYDSTAIFVVGSTAPASDSIAVADIISGLQFESKTCTIEEKALVDVDGTKEWVNSTSELVNGIEIRLVEMFYEAKALLNVGGIEFFMDVDDAVEVEGKVVTLQGVEEETCIVAEITPVTNLDTEIASFESYHNLILVGSPCINKAIGRVSGTGITCETWSLTSGQCIIKLASNGNKVALVVAGYTADDTRMCGKVILNYKDYTLSGTTVLVKGTTYNPTIVSPGYCGDGICNPSSESYYSCPKDCTACIESWTCIDWSTCVNNQQTRTCADANSCGTVVNKPATSQSCTNCTESWTCTSWGECTNGQKTRTCTDAKNCGTTLNKPAVSQSCISKCVVNGVCDFIEVSLNIAQTVAFKGKNVTLENVAEGGSVLVDVDGVKESVSTTQIVNEVPIKVKESSYNTIKAQRSAKLTLGENDYFCPEDCLKKACTEDWTCTDWSSCSNNQETRTCTDANNCGTTVNKSAETRSCDCTPNWECEINPSTCPSDGLQTKVCKDTACGSEDTREVTKCEYIPPGQEAECDGCLLDTTCVSFGFRREEKYCDMSKNFYPQKKSGESCDNNFECATNTCSKGVCIDLEKELKESMNVINKIWCKLLHPFSKERYMACLAG